MPKQPVPTLAAWFEQWLNMKDLRVASERNYRSQFTLHIAPALGDRRLDTLTKVDARLMMKDAERNRARRKGVLNPGRVNAQRVYALLRAMLNDAVEWDIIPSHKVVLRGMAKDASARRPDFTLAHYERVREHLTGSFGAAADIILGAGLRRGEALGLTWSDWDSQTGRLWVERQSDGVRVWETKTSHPAHVEVMHVGVVALGALRPRWATSEAPILQMSAKPGGKRMTKGALAREWNRARMAAGLPGFRLHDLRHLACTHMAQSGATVAEVQQFARHQDVGSALRYQHAGSDERRQELKAKADERMAAVMRPAVIL